MKRYQLNTEDRDFWKNHSELWNEREDGFWVRHEDAEQAEAQRDEAVKALRDLDSRKFDDANNMIHVDVPRNKPTEVWLDWGPVRRFIATALERLEEKK
jgi:hypothetical protein